MITKLPQQSRSHKLKQCKTIKLHYSKYLYKLVLTNSLAPWFRTEFQKDGKLGAVKKKIDEYEECIRDGKPLVRQIYRTEVPIKLSEFNDAKFIYKTLRDTKEDYKIRVEKWHSFNIYSNNSEFLEYIGTNSKYSASEFWSPDQNAIKKLLEEKNIIIVDNPPQFDLKVTLRSKRIDPRFANWLESNTDKSKVGATTLENIKQGWGGGTYFFVRDEKVLSMVEIIISDSIQKVERLIYKPNIDK